MEHDELRGAPGRRRSSVRRGPAARTWSWVFGTTLRRTRAQWRLLLGVVAVAVLASVLVTTLSILVAATEQGGVRGALAAIPAEQADFDVRLIDPVIGLADTRAAVTGAVDSVFAPAATTTSVGRAVSVYTPVTAIAGAPRADSPPTLAYFGEFENVEDVATLGAGAWPGGAAPGDAVQVAMPAAAAGALGLGVGSTVVVEAGDADVTAVVTGVYEPGDPGADLWALDRLASAGYEPEFPNPFTSFYNPTVVFGPLLVGAGGLADAGIPVAVADLRYTPDFATTTVAQLQPLLERLTTADVDILYRANAASGSVFVETQAAEAVSAVASGLVVTRSTVVVVSLLLAVLAVAAVAQLARLYSDARSGERQLMRARGASRRDILSLATVEAVVVAFVVAAVTPPLASLLYRLLAAQAPMVAAGMPSDAGIPAASWLVSAGIAVVFVLVLLSPLARADVSFAEGAQAAGRQRLASGIARSGIDVALVALAGIAYWQLQIYRTPVQESGSLTVDPVLVAGPAIVLVAAALVCARLIPAASRLLERLGSGARGATVALASWEIGRRPQRATAAVLLLSLTLAVGTFGLSFLDTWKQSQVDQAAFAVGAPVRVEARGAAADAVPVPDGGSAEPTLRRSLVIGGSSGAPEALGGGLPSVLALTPAARELASAGRLADLGGDEIVGDLAAEPSDATTVGLPDGTTGLAATVRIGDPAAPLEAVSADLTAVVENGDGRLVLLPLGRIKADGSTVAVSGELPPAAATGALRFAGFQARLIDTSGDAPIERGPEPADILLSDLAALVPTTSGETAPVAVAVGADGWNGSSATRVTASPATDEVPDGWQLRLGVTVPADLRGSPASFALVGWRPNAAVPAVLDARLADWLGSEVGTELAARVGGIPVPVRVAAVAPLVPGAARTDDLAGPTPALGGSAAQLAVVDATLLTRSLVEAGVEGALVDEWRVDLGGADPRAYLAALPPDVTAVSAELLGERLQEAPLRVATQAALWVAIAASTLLAAVGFGVHSAASLRSRRLELAQLRAIGYSRRRLVGLVGTESLLMCVLGSVFGVAIGVLLAFLVGPLVAVSPTGAPTVPSVVVEVPVLGIVLLLVWIVAVLAAVVLLVARIQRFTEPAHLLREGAQP